MTKIEINIGDLFIYKSKYGGIVKGEIAGFSVINSVDSEAGALIYKYKIKSSRGIWYDLDEVEICREFYTKEECSGIIDFFTEVVKKNNNLKKRLNI